MNLKTFLSHWGVLRDPFADEEARHDQVFRGLLDDGFEHSEATKIIGDLRRPASAVVFGEKGSGKTAIRMQVEAQVARHNAAHPSERVLVVPYDDLNPVLDRLVRRIGRDDPKRAIAQITRNDHIDGILATAVPRLVDRALAARGTVGRATPDAISIDEPLDPRTLRRLGPEARADWQLLQALYDRPELAVERSGKLRHRVRGGESWIAASRVMTVVLGAMALTAVVSVGFFPPGPAWLVNLVAAIVVLMALGMALKTFTDWVRLRALARRVSAELRVLDRSSDSIHRSLERLPRALRQSVVLPDDAGDDTRYELLSRLQRAVEPLGYRSVLVLMDRIDEPTLIHGDRSLMRAVVWPLLNNKLLQLPGYAFKMMLPIELRFALQGETNEFFEEARLDKQNMVDNLQWTGPTLYDLCNRRLRACAANASEAPMLADLFDEPGRKDLLAALDQMRQPRDAFKLLHQIMLHHCASVTEDEGAWQVPRHVIESVLDRRKERLDAARAGLAPG